VDFNSLLKQFFQERFLYRLSKSIYANNFILKGTLLFLAYDISRLRPTIDIDFKGQAIPNELDTIKKIVEEIVDVEAEDSVEFQKETLGIERIKEDAHYEGIRIKIDAKLGTVRDVVRIDIAFGDPVIHGPNEIEFPTILELETPKIKAYSIESSIAEKLQAIVSLSLASSRMKDYYDILYFASTKEFILSKLQKAISATFRYRQTELNNVNHIFNESFKQNKEMNKHWTAFVKRRKLNSFSNFSEALDKLEGFIKPILISDEEDKKWNPKSWNWS
jgi:predicted nucleotidyltransferase component of viral defense system